MVGTVAAGMTFVILTANIDLSVGSMVAFGGLSVAVLMAGGLHPALAIAVSLVGGTAIGALMGGISAYAKVPSFIVTLAGLVTVRGVTYLMSDGTPVGNLPKGFGAFGTAELPLFPGSAQQFPSSASSSCW